MEVKEITISNKDGTVITHIFEENGGLKAIVDEDYELVMKTKDLEREIQSLKKNNEILKIDLIKNIKSCKNNSLSLIFITIAVIFLSIKLWLG